jgi:hypothetical protein
VHTTSRPSGMRAKVVPWSVVEVICGPRSRTSRGAVRTRVTADHQQHRGRPVFRPRRSPRRRSFDRTQP